MTGAERLALDLASRALDYPDSAFFDNLDALRSDAGAMLEGESREAFLRFLARIEALGTNQAQEAYVATFDHDPGASLYMAWHRYGNDRGQGRALAALNGLYRSAGLEPEEGSMPDYLPRMLEFLAVSEPWAQEIMLDGFGAEMMRLVKHLEEGDSPYADLLQMALAPLEHSWPAYFRPRGIDPTVRPFARPEAEVLDASDIFRTSLPEEKQ